jgi:outer membrane protein assembly factor BamB
MNGPAQSRTPIVSITVDTATKVAYVGSQDGFVYAVDADEGSTLWSYDTGSMVQASPAGMFRRYGGAYDLLFVGTRDGAGENKMVALDPFTGDFRWAFDNGGASNAIGIISGGAYPVYGANRLYFTSRARLGGSAKTVWCLGFTDAPAGLSLVWSRELGDSDAAPVVYGDRVYVGTNDGTVWVLDAATGVTKDSYPTANGPVKGFVSIAFTAMPRRLYVATNDTVWGLTHEAVGTDETLEYAFSTSTVPSPSTPLLRFGTNLLYVGSTVGRLFEIDVTAPGSPKSVTLGDGSAQVGSPTLDTVNGLIHVGTESGVVYAVQAPLP